MPSAPPAEQSLERLPTRTLLAGHLGHLTPQQQSALEQFKQRLEEKGYYRPAREGKKASHEENTLVRFLRARKFDVNGAYEQFTAAEDWRKEQRVDELYDTFPLDEFEMARELYPQWTGRRDNQGLPLYVFEVGALTRSKTDSYAKASSRLEPRMFALYEHMLAFVLPLASDTPRPHPETPISGSSTIVDVSNVSLRRFWNLREHMQRASVLATARYPETLGSIYLVGAPNFFGVVWFDPNTVSKIHILSSSSLTSTLSQHIPLSSIPVKYGGQLEWSFGDPGPRLDEETRRVMRLGEGEECPRGPVRWEDGRVRVVGGEGRSEEERRRWEERAKEGEKVNGVVNGDANAGAAGKFEGKEEVEEREKRDEKPEDVPTASTAPNGTTSPPYFDAPSSSTVTTTSPTPAPVANEAPVVDASLASHSNILPPPLTDAALPASSFVPTPVANGTHEEAKEPHDIHVAARENPAAPVKELARVLEGTTL
ncbi:phosphatidylinositol transporter [Rhodosporidium toruloides NP11] [Rhodotorula toruloides]|uniref:BY PROTMAP: gi/472585314/gb/EMS22868.1/ phosphatidylinositol transporter [Rhodosporidium toruloides NP11] n=1 Tax=Rhodotorula toruloides TaxID=5286 RepID=A0A0K3CJG8_RHOTO|nr:phosphatidylinositol transporter [Rhodosporidium toruloides NP11] [Rhodotorula toruloides]